jgi:hypothetical protein
MVVPRYPSKKANMSLTAIPEDAGESGRESASPDRMAPPSTLHIQPVVDSQRGPAGYTAGASACLVYVCVCVCGPQRLLYGLRSFTGLWIVYWQFLSCIVASNKERR